MLLRPDRDLAELADDRPVALVARMDRDRAVAEHRLGPRRGDRDVVALFLKRDVPVLVLLDVGVGLAARERIFEVPHVALHFAVLDLEVADRGLELGVPVHEPLGAIEQLALVELDEDLDDGLREALVHGEALVRPVAGRAEAAELAGDRAARLRLPLPDMLEEGLAADLGALDPLALEVALDDHLRRDPGMVGADHPQGVLAAHALAPGQDVLQRIVERVADVQRARDVGRRHDDRPRLLVRPVGPEEPVGLPMVIPALLDGSGIEGLRQFAHRRTRLAMRRVQHQPRYCGCFTERSIKNDGLTMPEA